MTNTPSRFIWYELITSDIAAARRFYGAVLGWTARDSGQPGQDYRQWSIGGDVVGGLMALPGGVASEGMEPLWLGYLSVADVDASVRRILAAGGQVRMPAWDVPGVGRMAMVADPQGAAFYVMTPNGDTPSPAFSPGVAGHGGWNELHTGDWRAALEFYDDQFGFGKTAAMDMGPMGTYLLFNTGGDAVGGMMNSPAFPRPMWLYYFVVDDIHAGRDRIVAAGGAVLAGPHEVPSGDWIVQARDPQGAMFALVGNNPA